MSGFLKKGRVLTSCIALLVLLLFVAVNGKTEKQSDAEAQFNLGCMYLKG